MFDILELLGITKYDAFGQFRNPKEVINEWLEKRDLLILMIRIDKRNNQLNMNELKRPLANTIYTN